MVVGYRIVATLTGVLVDDVENLLQRLAQGRFLPPAGEVLRHLVHQCNPALRIVAAPHPLPQEPLIALLRDRLSVLISA